MECIQENIAMIMMAVSFCAGVLSGAVVALSKVTKK